MDLRLLIKSKNEGQQQEIALSEPKQFVLGRGPASAALLDGPGISREHVAVSVEEPDIFVADVSVNGTWVNGSRLAQHEKHRVAPGDVVEIPGYEFVFEFDHAVPPVASPSPPVKNADIPLQPQRDEATRVSAPSVGPVSNFIASFTLLDRFVIGLALISFLLALVYFLSL
jgi:pSer/pThr/pTyr-binding forkhead associated (FHA) protein